MLLAVLREPKQINLAGRWLAQHTVPVRAEPEYVCLFDLL